MGEAGSVLRRPLQRARYWMELHGVRVLEEDQRIGDMAMMMEIMEVSEGLDDAQSREEVDSLTATNNLKIRAVESQLSDVFKQEKWSDARALVEKLQMLTRLEDRMNDWRPSNVQ